MGRFMKILNILPSNYIGGPQKRVLSVSKALKDYSVETILICPKGTGGFAELAKKEGINVYQVNLMIPKYFDSIKSIMANIKWFLIFPISVFEIMNIIKKEDVDIVHIQGLLNLTGAFAAKIAHKKIVWHLIGSLYPKTILLLIMPLIILFSDYMIFIADKLSRYYLRGKYKKIDNYQVIYNGIDLKNFKPLNKSILREEMKISDQYHIIGCVGNINPAKGYEYLLEALSLIKTKKVICVIAGAKMDSQLEYYKMLKNYVIKHEIEEKVIFLGKRNDIPEIMNSLDIFILPSVTEGTPMAILEAMAMGKAIIATDVGGISEQIENDHDGIIIKAKKPFQLAKMIDNILNDDNLRNRLQEKARLTVENKFSIEKSVYSHINIYKKLLKTTERN